MLLNSPNCCTSHDMGRTMTAGVVEPVEAPSPHLPTLEAPAPAHPLALPTPCPCPGAPLARAPAYLQFSDTE